MSYDSTPDSNGNRGGRNRRRRNRNGRGGKGAPPSGTRPAFKTLDERGGFEKFLHTISFGLLCKPKQSSGAHFTAIAHPAEAYAPQSTKKN